MPNLRTIPYYSTVAKPKDSTTRGWWVGHTCSECGQPVRTTNKHGHYTITDKGVVTVRHTIRACPVGPNIFSTGRP